MSIADPRHNVHAAVVRYIALCCTGTTMCLAVTAMQPRMILLSATFCSVEKIGNDHWMMRFRPSVGPLLHIYRIVTPAA